MASDPSTTEPLNPLDPAMAVGPYPTYARLRATDPVHMSALGAFVLTRHADVEKLLGDDETFQHQYVAQQHMRVGPEVESEPYFDYFQRMVFVLDSPDHRRIRKLLHRAFTPARVREISERAAAIANALIDEHAAARRMDLVKDFAFPFPMRVIGAIMGLPDADHDKIGGFATALNPVLEFLPMSPEILATANNAVGELAEYFTALAAERRAEPTDDLFSAMVHASEDGDTLNDRELIGNAILLYIAGHDTTAGGIGLTTLNLDRHPSQRQLLRTRPELIPNAVEELLRYDTPGQGTARVVMADTTFANTTVPAGSFVLGYLGAANRDPEAYDDPDTLDITRDFASLPRTATWGGGPHLCLGRNLALQEFEIVLKSLLNRCPDLTVDNAEFRPTPLMRGLERLDVHW